MGIESHLDNLFAQHANDIQSSCADKLYRYSIDDSWSMYSKGLKVSGCCKVLRVSYSKSLDCNIYTIKDIDTDVEYCVNEFSINLTEKR